MSLFLSSPKQSLPVGIWAPDGQTVYIPIFLPLSIGILKGQSSLERVSKGQSPFVFSTVA